MDLRQEPTATDIAKILDSIIGCSDDAYPPILHVLRLLIEQSPPAREIHDRLHERRDQEPSLIELARLVIAVEDGEPYPESVHTLEWLIQRSEKASKLYQQLEQMADDAKLNYREFEWAVEALELSQELDRLLETLDDWQDARQVIELQKPFAPGEPMETDFALQSLLLVCRARIARSHGEQLTRLNRLRRRLQAAAVREISVTDPEERLNELENKLRSMANPEAALATVKGLSAGAATPPPGRRNET